MKKILPALLLIAIAFISATAITPLHAATAATLGVDSSTQQFPTATVGSTIVVNLTISNIQGLWAWDMENLNWSSNILSLVSANEGSFLKQAGQTMFLYPSDSVNTIASGWIPEMSDTLIEATSVSGSGVIVSFDFKVVALGTCDITFGTVIADAPPNVKTLAQNPISITGVNATVTVGAVNATPTPVGSATANPGSIGSPTSIPATTAPATSNSPTNDPSNNPASSPTPTINQAPEIPAVPTIALFAVLVAVCALLTLAKKSGLNKN
jgi:hypothetical protein